jgi:ABC-type cobalamin/Fe3+-siderophores transport system ATPase subunit
MDLGSQEQFLATVEALHRDEGSTILFVTHHIQIAARYATHEALVNAGQLIADGRDRVLQAELLEQAFGERGAAIALTLAKGGQA